MTNLDEDFTASVVRRGFFAQDEWTINDKVSLYADVRYETLRTNVSGPTLSPVSRYSAVTSPTAQVLWKFTAKDQLRLALGRSYKSPSARDLVPRRWMNNENSAASPNFDGNPALLPELSDNEAYGMELEAKGKLTTNIGLFPRIEGRFGLALAEVTGSGGGSYGACSLRRSASV